MMQGLLTKYIFLCVSLSTRVSLLSVVCSEPAAAHKYSLVLRMD